MNPSTKFNESGSYAFAHYVVAIVLTRQVIQRPAVSLDNEFIAFITHDSTVQVVSVRTGVVISILHFAKATRSFFLSVKFLTWSPKTLLNEENLSTQDVPNCRARILLIGDHRLIVLELDLSHRTSFTESRSADAHIIADYQLEAAFGCIATADFVLDHDHILVTFEMNTHASLISLARPRRDDIPLPKFSDSRGIAKSKNGQNFSLLLRSRGQDQVANFSINNGDIENSATFTPKTTDAQGLIWSPRDDPVLAIWDSATYGLSVQFFTVLGHHLKQLDIRPENNLDLHGLSAIGVTSICWTMGKENDSLLAVGVGDAKLIIQEQNERSMTTSRRSIYLHPSIIDTADCIVWQQTQVDSFEVQTASFEMTFESSTEVNLIEMNGDKSIFATRLDTLPKALWIWSRNKSYPIALLFFQRAVKQVVWHPARGTIMAIITNEKTPCVYIYHDFSQPPVKVVIPFESILSTNKSKIQWVSLSGMNRSPLVFSSNRQFELGFLSYTNGTVEFKSGLLIDLNFHGTEEDISVIDTPSKPHRGKQGTAGWTLDDSIGLQNPNFNPYE